MGWRRTPIAVALLLCGACTAAPRRVVPPPPAPPPAPVEAVAEPETVWTAQPGTVLRADTAEIAIARPFTRLDVLGADSLDLRVACSPCGHGIAGRIGRGDALHHSTSPDSAASGTVAQFALAIRRAAVRRDILALGEVMSTDFSFSALGVYGRDRALASWNSENYRTLDQVAALLDGGLSPLNGFWVAPAAFASTVGYRGLRLGFRRDAEGRWEWVYLMRGEGQ